MRAELREDARDVSTNRAAADSQPTCDLLVGLPVRQQAQNVELAAREVSLGSRRRGPALGQDAPSQRRIDLELATMGGADRRRDLVGVGVLEQVARCARGQRGVDSIVLAEGRQSDDLDSWIPVANT